MNLKDMSIEELEALVKAAQEEISSRAKRGVARIEFYGYNARRYSKPWIAVVTDWPVGGRPELEFGSFVGNDTDGGFVEIEAKEGQIIRWGQKDGRGNGTKNKWGVFRDGQVQEITAEEARDIFNK